MNEISSQIDHFFDQVRNWTPEQRTEHLQSMTRLLKEASVANEQKVNLAAQAYDLVLFFGFYDEGGSTYSSFG
jgi:hypothetical protein